MSFFCNSKDLNDYLQLLNEEENPLSLDDVICSSVEGIATLLNRPQTRHVGLLVLQTYLQQCTIEVIERKGIQWATLVLRSCNPKDMPTIGNIVYPLLKSLISTIHKLHEVPKSFVSNLLSSVYESLNFVTGENTLTSLKWLETCLRLYSAPTEPYREKIEKFLLKFIDHHNMSVVRWSAKCLNLLQQVRCSTARNIDSKKHWEITQIKLIGSLHSILNSAFEHCTEFVDHTIESEVLVDNALELSDHPSKKAAQIYIRVRNLIIFLKVMLLDQFSSSKPVAIEKLISLISRGLGVNCQMLIQNNISDNLAISGFLTHMHIHFYELLETLIVVMKSHLAIFQISIMQFFVETFTWTKMENPSECPLSYMTLRSKAYNVLTKWCQAMSYGSRCEIYADSILPHITGDMNIMLKFTSKLQGEIKKPIGENFENEIQNLVASALKCLNSFIQSTSCMISPEHIKDIQVKVTSICASFQGISEKTNSIHYRSSCRLEAYKVLQSIVMSPNHLYPPPIETVISLLQTSLFKDINFHVRQNNALLLSSIEKIIHPQKECLLFPTSYRDIKNAFKNITVAEDKIFKNDKNPQNAFNEICDNEELNGETEVIGDVVNISSNSSKTLEVISNVEINEIDETIKIARKDANSDMFRSSKKLSLTSDDDSGEILIKNLNRLNNDSVSENDTDSDNMNSQPLRKKRREQNMELSKKNVEEISNEEKGQTIKEAEKNKEENSVNNNLSAENGDDLFVQISSAFVDELN